MFIYDPIGKALGISPLKNFHYDFKKLLEDHPPTSIPATNLIEISDRMKKNNPMKNPEIAKKVADKNRGKPSKNKILKIFTWYCEWCGKEHIDRDTVKNRKHARFCGKSCAASYSNTHRYR